MQITRRDTRDQIAERELRSRGQQSDAPFFDADFEFVAFADPSLLKNDLWNPDGMTVAPFDELDLDVRHDHIKYIHSYIPKQVLCPTPLAYAFSQRSRPCLP